MSFKILEFDEKKSKSDFGMAGMNTDKGLFHSSETGISKLRDLFSWVFFSVQKLAFHCFPISLVVQKQFSHIWETCFPRAFSLFKNRSLKFERPVFMGLLPCSIAFFSVFQFLYSSSDTGLSYLRDLFSKGFFTLQKQVSQIWATCFPISLC